MTSQEKILVNVRSAFAHLPNVIEKKMFGKLAFMVIDKLCIAVGKEDILCRVDPSSHDTYLQKTECRPVIMRGKEMKGYVYIKNSYFQEEKEVERWLNRCLEYNRTLS